MKNKRAAFVSTLGLFAIGCTSETNTDTPKTKEVIMVENPPPEPDILENPEPEPDVPENQAPEPKENEVEKKPKPQLDSPSKDIKSTKKEPQKDTKKDTQKEQPMRFVNPPKPLPPPNSPKKE
jgi:periplasmic protein TonB